MSISTCILFDILVVIIGCISGLIISILKNKIAKVGVFVLTMIFVAALTGGFFAFCGTL